MTDATLRSSSSALGRCRLVPLTVVAGIAATSLAAVTAAAAVPAAPEPVEPRVTTGTIASTASAAPSVRFDRRRHDFGPIWDFEEGKTAFTFTNTGDATLEILTVKASCGCTATQLDRTTFAPGEGDEIRVTFDPRGRGRQAKTITVLTNAGPPIVLTIAAEVKPFIDVDPVMLRLGDIRLGEARTATFTIRAADPAFEVTGVRVLGTTSRYVSARLLPPATAVPSGPRRPGEAMPAEADPGVRTVSVVVSGEAPWGSLFSSVEVAGLGRTPDEPKARRRSATVSVSGRVFGEVIASDTMVRVSRVPAGKPFERQITFRSRTGERLPLLGARLTNPTFPGLNVRLDPVEGTNRSSWRLTVSGDPGDYVGRVGGVVTVRSAVPGEERISFQVAGMIAADG